MVEKERFIVFRQLTEKQMRKAIQQARENGRKAEAAMKQNAEIRAKSENYASPSWNALMLLIAIANILLSQALGFRIAGILWSMAAAGKAMQLAGLPKSDKSVWLVIWATCAVGGCIALIIEFCMKGNP